MGGGGGLLNVYLCTYEAIVKQKCFVVNRKQHSFICFIIQVIPSRPMVFLLVINNFAIFKSTPIHTTLKYSST